MLVEVLEPWTPAQATERIRNIATGEFNLLYKLHAREQIDDRGLIAGDMLFLLKNGFVYVPAEEATRRPFWKYQMQCRTPNSNNRAVRCVLIPDWKRRHIKILTVMWASEPLTRGR